MKYKPWEVGVVLGPRRKNDESRVVNHATLDIFVDCGEHVLTLCGERRRVWSHRGLVETDAVTCQDCKKKIEFEPENNFRELVF